CRSWSAAHSGAARSRVARVGRPIGWRTGSAARRRLHSVATCSTIACSSSARATAIIAGGGRPAGSGTSGRARPPGRRSSAVHATEDGRADGPENRALALAIAERDRVGWWERDPVYLDRRGLAAVPAVLDVRRYRGRDGETLLVVDNWDGHRGLSVTLDGRSV